MTFLELIPFLIGFSIIVFIFWGVLKYFLRKKIGIFSLIGLLLIFVPIGGMLVSNFMEAQIRSNFGRLKADARTLATALNSYYHDHGSYPKESNLSVLTTPTSYISQIPDDFYGSLINGERRQFLYSLQLNEADAENSFYVISGIGPDGDSDLQNLSRPFSKEQLATITYDSSNGTISDGDFIRIDQISLIEDE